MMKKEKNGVKATLLSLVMAVVLMLPMSLLAQKSDGFFRSNNNDDVYNDRDASTLINGGGFTNNPMNQQDPNSPAPLGSGLLIMVAAGAGYAVAHRKKAVRKGAALLMAGVLMLGLAQCRKKDVATVVDNTANLVPMTLTTDGAKTSFDDGVISWVSDDKLNVVAGGKCIGTLTYDGSEFTGYVNLDDFSESDETTFYFYYVGNQTIGSGETSFTMSMSGQTGAKANLGDFHVSKGLQYVIINKEGMNVSATMRSYTSVAYFNVSGFNEYGETGENLYMYGDNIYEQLTINFSDNSITPEHDGYYISAGTSADKANAYYMFIPTSADGQTEVNHVVNFVNKRTSATTTFKYGIVSNGWYCDGGFNEPIAVTGASYDAGTLRGEFTINGSGKKVRFSQGNLQAIKNVSWPNCIWSFKDNQYDMDAEGSVGDNYANRDYVSHMGYGTSGYNNGQTAYYPNSTITTSTNYLTTELTGNKDWGYNKITNGGNTENNGWYTLSGGNSSEWLYILNNRNVSNPLYTNGRLTLATIATNYKGMVIFPDHYIHPTNVTITNAEFNKGSNFSATINSIEDWYMMEAAGAVFLPAAGWRNGTSSPTNIGNVNSYGYYWARTTGSSYPNNMNFYNGAVNMTGSYCNRAHGYSVRLVKDVE